MHVVHVQGGATARVDPTGSQAAILSSRGVFTGRGLGMLPSGSGPSGSGVGGPTGGVGGSEVAQAAEALNSTAWCLIDDEALGMHSTPAMSTTRTL